MTPGRKPLPTAIRRQNGNLGKRGYNKNEPEPPGGVPSCPEHLSDVAQDEWDRLVIAMHRMGVLTEVDRAAFAAYCQAYGRWVEAEHKLRDLPAMVKTPSGYVQQNPWLGVANKQLELMGRFMAEFGMTPASRSRLTLPALNDSERIDKIEVTIVGMDDDGNRVERRLDDRKPATQRGERPGDDMVRITVDDES